MQKGGMHAPALCPKVRAKIESNVIETNIIGFLGQVQEYIIDKNGNIIYSYSFNVNQKTCFAINVGGLPSGSYSIIIEIGFSQYKGKFMK